MSGDGSQVKDVPLPADNMDVIDFVMWPMVAVRLLTRAALVRLFTRAVPSVSVVHSCAYRRVSAAMTLRTLSW